MRRLAPLLLMLAVAAPAQAGDLSLTLTTAAGDAIGDAVVMVQPDAGPARGARIPGPFVMAQKDMAFQPAVLIVPVGAEVAFPNLDPFHHHVYSFSKAKTFELKLYGQAEVRRVTFDKAGVVAIGCNIHDQMSAYIRVVDTPYAARTAATGATTLRELPAGPATVVIWHPRLKAHDGEIRLRVTVPASGVVKLAQRVELRGARLRRADY